MVDIERIVRIPAVPRMPSAPLTDPHGMKSYVKRVSKICDKAVEEAFIAMEEEDLPETGRYDLEAEARDYLLREVAGDIVESAKPTQLLAVIRYAPQDAIDYAESTGARKVRDIARETLFHWLYFGA